MDATTKLKAYRAQLFAIENARLGVVDAACEYIHAGDEDVPSAYVSLERAVAALERLSHRLESIALPAPEAT